METLTTAIQRESIQKLIQTELLKRGFTAPIKSFEEVKSRSGGNHFEFHTEGFQTTPVLFKSIRVANFSSSVVKEKFKILEDSEKEETRLRVWISVHVDYEHFGGGRNGCKLFDVYGYLFLESPDLIDPVIR